MPITYTISADKTLIHEVWMGDVSAKDLKEYWTTYLQDPDVLAIRRTLVDLRGANTQFTGRQLAELISSIVVPALNGRDWISAFLVGESVQFGVSRQYQVFAELYSRDSIFDDPEKAENWLRRQTRRSDAS